MKKCSIVEDLLPLYNDDLLQEETKNWVEDHLATCESCAKIARLSKEPMETEKIDSPIDYEKMMKKNTLKISIYQLIFVGHSFFLAMRSSVLMDDFSFILYYTLLGFVTYLFYKRYVIVTIISFVPTYLWHVGYLFTEMDEVLSVGQSTFGELLLNIFYGSFIWAGLNLLFALIGATSGFVPLNLFESGYEQ